MAMEGDDFVNKSSQGSASKSKGAKDDSKFVRPLPVTLKAKEKSSGRKRVSGSADLTTVAGKLIKTDDCLHVTTFPAKRTRRVHNKNVRLRRIVF